jgi:hypothetical protein
MLASVDPEQAESQAPVVESLRRPAALETHLATPEGARADPLPRLAAAAGNRGFTRTIARLQAGEGLLPGGLVHPDVEAAIAAASGGGRALDAGVAARAGAQLGDSFSDVRVHHDDHAAALSRAVSARAFTVGRDIFFGAGEYNPGSAGGRELLTHELTHVVQQRGAPLSGPLSVSQPGDALEREAEAAARGIG